MKKRVLTNYKKRKIETAPINKRAFAFVLDWYLGSAFSAIPVVFLWNKLTGETIVNTDLTLFESPYGLLAGVLGLVFGCFYFFVLPAFVWEGQTFGKKLLKLKIVADDGSTLSISRMALRQILGIIFMEGAFMLTGNYFTQMISLLTMEQAGQYISYLMVLMFVGSVLLTSQNKQSIHDMLAQSIVVEKE